MDSISTNLRFALDRCNSGRKKFNQEPLILPEDASLLLIELESQDNCDESVLTELRDLLR